MKKAILSEAMPEHAYRFEQLRPTTYEERGLLEKYPLFFRAAVWPSSYQCSLAHWGIECGWGWYDLIDQAAKNIESELNRLLETFCIDQHLPWLDRRLQYANDGTLGDSAGEDAIEPLLPFCAEVKERSGILKIYICNGHICDGTTWLRIRNAVLEVEKKSSVTCERCGQPGLFQPHTWNRVYCDRCASGA